MECSFSVILAMEGTILVVRPEQDIGYFARAYIPHDKKRSTEWDLVAPSDSTVKHMTDVEYLFNLSEEELFQESCTVPYDPYYVLSAMKYMKNHIDHEPLFSFRGLIQLEY